MTLALQKAFLLLLSASNILRHDIQRPQTQTLKDRSSTTASNHEARSLHHAPRHHDRHSGGEEGMHFPLRHTLRQDQGGQRDRRPHQTPVLNLSALALHVDALSRGAHALLLRIGIFYSIQVKGICADKRKV